MTVKISTLFSSFPSSSSKRNRKIKESKFTIEEGESSRLSSSSSSSSTSSTQTTTAISAATMSSSRDHPFNRSTRPLLMERKPHLLLNGNSNNSNNFNGLKKFKNITKTSSDHHYQQQQQQQQQLYNSTTNSTGTKLHGFNDFADIISQQYRNLNTHIGYPYGSPPSPTANSDDFVFSDDDEIPARTIAAAAMATSATTATTATATSTIGTTIDAEQNFQQTTTTAIIAQQNNNENYNNVMDTFRKNIFNDKIINNTETAAWETKAPLQVGTYQIEQNSQQPLTATWYQNSQQHCNNLETNYDNHKHKNHQHNQQHYLHHNQYQNHQQQYGNYDQQQINSNYQEQNFQIYDNKNESRNSENDGPFIFGIHTSTVNNNGNYYMKENNSSVINNTIRKYSTGQQNHQLVGLNQSNSSDTSTSSRDDSEKDGKHLVKSRKGHSKRTNNKVVAADKKKSNGGKENRPKIKCVLVGDGTVGKTNLIVTYLENRFIKEHVPTASDIYNAEVMVNDSPVHVTICDTAGQDTLDPLRELCYPDSDVFLLCFSVVKPETFRSIKIKWAPKFSKTKASLILVGTQADLRNDMKVLNKLQVNGEKSISFADAWDLATSIGAKYVETSSFTQDKVKDVFDTAIWEALVPHNLPPKPPLWKRLLCLA